MRHRPLAPTSAVALLALALAGCARNNGSRTESSPAAVEPSHGAVVEDKTVAEGDALYQQYCKLCHAADGTGYAADNAPSLVSHHFLKSAPDEFIARGISVGRPGTAMAAYGKRRGGPLDDMQIFAIVAFLRSKGPRAVPIPESPHVGNAALGGSLFEEHCQDCHGTRHVRGTAPSLHNPEFLASASPHFIRYAIEHGRPPAPMPSFAGKLSATEIGDIVTFLHHVATRGRVAPPVKNPHVPDDLPPVVNPDGSQANFTLREGRYVSAAQVKQALDAKQRVVLLDARPPSDWIQFRIPGAIPFPYYQAPDASRIPNDGTWVVAYCACPHHASGEVVDALRLRGYAKTAVLDEGILVWRTLGYPLVGESVSE